jgi:hypothetical protein
LRRRLRTSGGWFWMSSGGGAGGGAGSALAGVDLPWYLDVAALLVLLFLFYILVCVLIVKFAR